MARNDLGHWVSGTSGDPGGRPKSPDSLKTRLAELSPCAVERLGELVDSYDDRIVHQASDPSAFENVYMPHEYSAENHDWDLTARAAWNLLMLETMISDDGQGVGCRVACTGCCGCSMT